MSLINNKFIRTYDDPRVLMLKGVRLSFTEALKDKKVTARGVDDAKPKHGCNVIIEKDQPGFDEKHKAVVKAIEAACEQKWKRADKWKSIQEDAPKRIAYRKGDRFKNQESGEVYNGYAGNMAFSGSGPGAGDRRPTLYARDKRTLGAPGEAGVFPVDQIPEIFYSGSYADVKISFFGTDKGGDGVFITIESIRSLQTGERQGGGVSTSADEFDDAEDDDFDGDTSSNSKSSSDDSFDDI
jgi:hypothetical protein